MQKEPGNKPLKAGINRFPKTKRVADAVSLKGYQVVDKPNKNDQDQNLQRIRLIVRIVMENGTESKRKRRSLPLTDAVGLLRKNGWKKANCNRLCNILLNIPKSEASRLKFDQKSNTLIVPKGVVLPEEKPVKDNKHVRFIFRCLPSLCNAHIKPLGDMSFTKMFDAQVEYLIQRLEPDANNIAVVHSLVDTLRRATDMSFPMADFIVNVFGSRIFCLATKTSDVDIIVSIRPREPTVVYSISSVMTVLLRKMTRSRGFTSVIPIRGARVPIIKFVYCTEYGTVSGDISFNSSIGLIKSDFINSYIYADTRVRPFLYMVKLWAKTRLITESNVLNSYSLIMMAIAFLIQSRVVPPLQLISSIHMSDFSWDTLTQIQKSPDNIELLYTSKAEIERGNASSASYCIVTGDPIPARTTDGIYTYYYDKSDIVKWESPNTWNLYVLLFKFFHHYGFEFDPLKHVISPRLGTTMSSRNLLYRLDLDNQFHRFSTPTSVSDNTRILAIEDPFETNHNPGRLAKSYWVRGFLWEMRRACWVMGQKSTAQSMLDRLFTSPNQALYKDISVWADVYNVRPPTPKYNGDECTTNKKKGTASFAKNKWTEDDFICLSTDEVLTKSFGLASAPK